MDPNQAALIRHFNRHYTLLLGILDKQVFDTDLTWPESRLLLEISFHYPITPMKLSRSLHLDKSYTSRLVNQLVRKQEIKKEPSPTDLRSVEIFLTSHGQQTVAYLNQKSNAQIQKILTSVPEQQQTQLYQAFKLINTILFEK